ncbi:23S rRNA-associated protein [Mizugakiibacter sediminis]|uniref:23S rRNA-associated protein n=1 Tax=Mizugakiibacter sediminis TaxID=1475481 RepID=A0A0K8QJI0_9GAMM|nr:four helix bundle protein [Mizugakiibacter sediminis]GAP65090.1 23S rRNA-associated protein [Mizugakiibacter sediminis]
MALKPGHYRLLVWQEAMRLVRQVYLVTDGMPGKERYGLQSQIRRAVTSIPSNIAEGAARGSKAEYMRFLQIARGSLMELDTQLLLGQDLGYLGYDDGLRSAMESVLVKLNGLISSKQTGGKRA